MIDPKIKRIIFYQIIIWGVLYISSLFIVNISILLSIAFAFNLILFYFIGRPETSEIEEKLISQEKNFNNEKDRLEIENRLYRIMFESIDDPVFIMNQKMDLFYFNNKFEKLFNLGRPNIGAPLIQFIRNFEFQNFLENAIIENRQKEIAPFSFSNDQDPNRQYFHIKIIPIKFSSHFLCVFNDITERKMADQIREDFISNFSHEIRTPLTILNGQLQALRSEIKKPSVDDQQINLFLNKIENNSRRLTSLFDDMLNLTSIEKQKSINLEKFDLNPMLDILTQDLTLKYTSKKINFEFKIDNHLIEADYNLLEQALINLIENAIKYSERDPIIKVHSLIESNYYLIQISDNGIGIPEDQRHRIFERFFRVDLSRSQEISGTGLGLSIVKHIVQKHNGRIKVVSEQNVGTTFSIYLPILNYKPKN